MSQMPSVVSFDVFLTEDQATALREENRRQEVAGRFALDDESEAARAAFAALAGVIPGMSEVCALQDALPSGARLLWPDGTVARFATVDLGRPSLRE